MCGTHTPHKQQQHDQQRGTLAKMPYPTAVESSSTSTVPTTVESPPTILDLGKDVGFVSSISLDDSRTNPHHTLQSLASVSFVSASSSVQPIRLPVGERDAMCLWTRLGWQRSEVQIKGCPWGWVTFDVPTTWRAHTEHRDDGFVRTTIQHPDYCTATVTVTYSLWCGTSVLGVRSVLNTLSPVSQPIRSSLLYSLRSSTAVLGYFCNFCEAYQDFAYTEPNAVIGWWTWEKQCLICPNCVTSNTSKIMLTTNAEFNVNWSDLAKRAQWIFLYRPLAEYHDLPIERCFFASSDSEDSLWNNDMRNKQEQRRYFCTTADELKEFAEVVAAHPLHCNASAK